MHHPKNCWNVGGATRFPIAPKAVAQTVQSFGVLSTYVARERTDTDIDLDSQDDARVRQRVHERSAVAASGPIVSS